ncbi:winged helix-turn-helix transcriptional regulator [Roseibium sp. M-1]
MNAKKQNYDSGCPVAFALDIFGDQWTLLIIRDMALKGVRTYGELLEGWEGISTNILAQRLRHLEEKGLITKRRDPENWRSFVYELTQKGRGLGPVLAEIILWSGKYNSAAHAMKDTLEKVHADRVGFEKSIANGEIP